MSFTSRPTQGPAGIDRTVRPSGKALPGDPDGEWGAEEKPARDWKKFVLVAGLGLLSWVATYVGMLELIEANMGELPLVHKLIIGFSVAMLMIMVVWLLDEMFKPNPFSLKVIYAAGYLFLTIISVGFGFGFYWKVLESRGESTRSAESAVGQVQGSLTAATARLEQLQSTLDQLTAISTQKAQTERASGTSCPASKPGDGPRRKLREDDAGRFSFASEFVKGRTAAVKAEMATLDADLIKISTADASTIDTKSGTRNAFMQGVGRKLDGTVTTFNAFRTDPQLKQIRADLAERAEKSTFPDGAGKTFICPDPQLQAALRGVVRAIDGLPELEKPKIAAVEGSEATIEAFRRLVASFSGLLQFKLPPSADELRDLQKKAIQSVESPSAASAAKLSEQPGLSKRDYVPLAIAVFVDLCLLLVSMGRSHDRLSGLVPKMRAAERGPVIQILSRFNDIHRDRQIRENFDLFRHVVFDFHGDYYVAVPLDAPRRMNPHEREELRLEAQLLSNLFASFEKERIFSRVYSPLLMTSTVKKRLARQGSKFAASDAFRIYRFKDGAWSDIILGAVMGAARRVEAEKRTLALRADELARNAPLPDPVMDGVPGHRTVHTGTSFGGSPFDHQSAPPSTRTGTTNQFDFANPVSQRPTYRASGTDPDLSRQFGTYAPFVADPRQQPAAQAGSSFVFADNVHPLTPRTTDAGPDGTAPEHDLRPANSNTASSRPIRETAAPVADVVPFAPVPATRPSNAMPGPIPQSFAGSAAPRIEIEAYPAGVADASAALPQANPAEQRAPESPPPLPIELAKLEPIAARSATDWQNELGIVMTRVTESITVPVSSEARLPQALMAAGLFAAARPTETAQIEHNRPVDRNGDWSDADAALARRYANNPAE
jgi:hypothetical protein